VGALVGLAEIIGIVAAHTNTRPVAARDRLAAHALDEARDRGRGPVAAYDDVLERAERALSRGAPRTTAWPSIRRSAKLREAFDAGLRAAPATVTRPTFRA
jgi:hypothetical protein